jgi:hypothetical protein
MSQYVPAVNVPPIPNSILLSTGPGQLWRRSNADVIEQLWIPSTRPAPRADNRTSPERAPIHCNAILGEFSGRREVL